MSAAASIQIKYRFEKAPVGKRRLSNAIERFGNLATQVVQFSPSAVPHLSLGRAEKIADGLLDPGLIAPQPKFAPQSEQLRLKCVEDQSGPLIEYHYDTEGRIHEVILLGSFREKFAWSDDGKLLSVAGRDSQLTRFGYRDDGLLCSISYPNGSLFKYTHDEAKRLHEVTYPDGVSVVFVRSADGRIIRVESRDGVFEYSRDATSCLREVLFRTELGAWGFKSGESGGKLKTPFHGSRSGSGSYVASALGLWRYDSTPALREMFVPAGERLVVRDLDEHSEIATWSTSGQTTYRFDKSGVVASLLNSNGTHAIFKRLIEDNAVLLVSTRGVAVLHYDKAGQLRADRDQHGRGAIYSFTTQSELKSFHSAGQTVSLTWARGNNLKKIRVGNSFWASATVAEGYPTRLECGSKTLTNAETANVFIGFLWNWQVTRDTRRLTDAAFNGGNNGTINTRQRKQ